MRATGEAINSMFHLVGPIVTDHGGAAGEVHIL